MAYRRETMETVRDFILGGSKITADGDCSHKIKRCLLLGWKAMTNLDSIFKKGHHFANKGLYSQSYGFSSSHVWMWELDHKDDWALKNWCFWTVVLEKTLESPLNSKEFNQSKLKEINTEHSLEGLMLKLKLQYFAYQMQSIRPRPGAVAGRSNPNIQRAVAVWVQEGWEELLHVHGQEGQLWGDTPHPR